MGFFIFSLGEDMKILLREPLVWFILFVVVILGPMIYSDIRQTNVKRERCIINGGIFIKTDNVNFTCFDKGAIK